MRSGDSLTQLVEFSEGFPDGNVAWSLVDGDNVVVTSGSVTPAAASVSCVITVGGAFNTVASGLYANRELRWSYAVGGVTQAGVNRYRVDAFLKFGVSERGVRNKLGIELHEIADEDIDLVHAYSQFQNTVTAAVLNAVTDAYVSLLVRDAIEALAGLKLIRQLQVKIAKKEVSQTSQYERQGVKWDAIEAALLEMIAAGYSAIDPTIDPTVNYGSIFIAVVRDPDVVTGATPA